MSKWRIKVMSNKHGISYVLQKRFLGFLWWYNPDNIDGCTTGLYDTLDQAKEAYEVRITPIIVDYIDIEPASKAD